MKQDLEKFIEKILQLTSQYYIFPNKVADAIYQEIVQLWSLNKDEVYAHTLESEERLLDYKRYKTVELLTEVIYPKYKFSEFGRLYLEENEFNSYYESIMDDRNWHSYDRKYNLKELLKQTRGINGDIVECGVYKGASAMLMCDEAKQKSNVLVHLFDSFEGLSKPKEVDGFYWTEGRFDIEMQDLYNNLRLFNNYKIYKGWIPDEFYKVENLSFKFIHIDVDLYEPTLNSLEFFYPRLNKGGIVLLDDYGFYSCPGAKAAVDEFCRLKKINVSTLSSGQGIIIKSND